MYLPAAFRMDDRQALMAHIEAYPFATLVTHGRGPDAGTVEASHLPFIVDRERGELRGHLAKENPQLQHLQEGGSPVLAIFHGPHGYVSPSVYLEPGVPTWNFVVVHARGRVRILDDATLRGVLDETVSHFDSSGWRGTVTDAYLTAKSAGIVAFAIAIESLEGKWKISQNRSAEDRERVIAWLDKGTRRAGTSLR